MFDSFTYNSVWLYVNIKQYLKRLL